jgi:mannose-6-phosphate isomerase-like protein (cupin superfamily)
MKEEIRPVEVSTAEHYVWGGVCDGWHLLKLSDLSVIQERVPAHGGESNHYHSLARQFFYVLSGTGVLEFDGARVSLSAGQGVHVPPGVPHRFANEAEVDVVFLVISAPATSGDRTNL